MKSFNWLALFLLLAAAARPGYAQAPSAAAPLRFKPCRITGDYEDKTSSIDSASAYPDALYAVVNGAILCVGHCGSVYVFKSHTSTAGFYPSYLANTCYDQYELASHAVVADDYVFLLSNRDTYLTSKQVRLLRVDLQSGKVTIIDRGDIAPELTYLGSAGAVLYKKDGAAQRYLLTGRKRARVS